MNRLAILPFGIGGFVAALSLTLFTSALVSASGRSSQKPAQPKAPAAKPAAGAKPAATPSSAPAAPRPTAAQSAAQKAAAKQTAAKNQKKAPAFVMLHTDFELHTGDDVLLRTASPPLKYSDKGLIQNYTLAELKKVKGDHPELPGFPTEIAQVKNGQLLVVYFGKKAPTSSASTINSSSTSPETSTGKPFGAGDNKLLDTADGKALKKNYGNSAEVGEAKALNISGSASLQAANLKALKTRGGKPVDTAEAKSLNAAAKPVRWFIPPVAGVLGGVVSRYDDKAKTFVLRVDTQHEAGKVPTINSKEMLKDFEITLIVIMN